MSLFTSVPHEPCLRDIACPTPVSCAGQNYRERRWVVFQPLSASFRRLEERQPELENNADLSYMQCLLQDGEGIFVWGARDDPVGAIISLPVRLHKICTRGIEVCVRWQSVVREQNRHARVGDRTNVDRVCEYL